MLLHKSLKCNFVFNNSHSNVSMDRCHIAMKIRRTKCPLFPGTCWKILLFVRWFLHRPVLLGIVKRMHIGNKTSLDQLWQPNRLNLEPAIFNRSICHSKSISPSSWLWLISFEDATKTADNSEMFLSLRSHGPNKNFPQEVFVFRGNGLFQLSKNSLTLRFKFFRSSYCQGVD